MRFLELGILFLFVVVAGYIASFTVQITRGYSSEKSPVEYFINLQVLNGCGVNNAGSIVADYLRGQGFDVKNVDNAPTWNYRESIIVSRGSDMRIALRVARALRTDRVVMLREHNSQYDVAVFVGGDFKERLR